MEVLLKDETYRILGACFKVYNEMGPGFLEAVYHECLGVQFLADGIPFVSRPPLNISYRGVPLLTGYGSVIVEIKAAECLAEAHRAQVINYLKATGHRVGLLVNFGSFPKVEHQRFVHGFGPLGQWHEMVEA